MRISARSQLTLGNLNVNTTERGTNAHYIQFSLQYTSSSAYTLQYSLSHTRYLVLIINAVQFSIIQITVEVEAWISTTVVKAVYRVAGTLLRVTVQYISLQYSIQAYIFININIYVEPYPIIINAARRSLICVV